MNENSNPRTQALIALGIVILAAVFSWKVFYHDPHAELSSLENQVSALTAETDRSASSQVAKQYVADQQTLMAVKSAIKPLDPAALRQQVGKAAEGSGLKVKEITVAGGDVTLSGTGSASDIGGFLDTVQGSLRLENGQIRGGGAPVFITSATISGKTPQEEAIYVTVSSGS